MSTLVSFVINFDDKLVADVAHHRSARLTRLMVFCTWLGDGWIWLVTGLLVLLLDSDAGSVFPQILLGLLLDIPLYCFLKKRFSRPRPYEACSSITCIHAPLDRFSFPSGHTSVAFVMLVTLGAIYSWLLPALALLALLIGVSRVYLGAHYPSDVIVGSLVGMLCGSASTWLF